MTDKKQIELNKFELKFQVDDNNDFITRNHIKEGFIEKINYQQKIMELYEKDRFHLMMI